MTALTLALAGPFLHAAGASGAWQHSGPPFGPFFLLVPLFWLLVLGALVFAVVRSRRHGGPSWSRGAVATTDAAERMLAERFARGDVDEAEYRLRLEVLRGTDGKR